MKSATISLKTMSLKKIDRLIKTSMDLLEKYKASLRVERRSRRHNAQKIKWYKENISSLENTIISYFEYRKVREFWENDTLDKIKTMGR